MEPMRIAEGSPLRNPLIDLAIELAARGFRSEERSPTTFAAVSRGVEDLGGLRAHGIGQLANQPRTVGPSFGCAWAWTTAEALLRVAVRPRPNGLNSSHVRSEAYQHDSQHEEQCAKHPAEIDLMNGHAQQPEVVEEKRTEELPRDD